MRFKSGVKGRGSDGWWERRWWLWWGDMRRMRWTRRKLNTMRLTEWRRELIPQARWCISEGTWRWSNWIVAYKCWILIFRKAIIQDLCCRKRNRAMQGVFPTPYDALSVICSGSGRSRPLYTSTGLTNMKLNIRCSILLPKCKSKWNVKLTINVFKTECLITLQRHRKRAWEFLLVLKSSLVPILSFRISEISLLKLLYAESHFFYTPTLSWPKFRVLPME